MNIDTTKIEGYADMTAEEKVAALEAYSTPDPDMSGYVKKDLFDKTASEAASWKKQYRDTLDAAERDKQEREEKDRETAEKLAQYEHKEAVSTNAQKFRDQGYSEEDAQAVAEALVSGDTAAFLTANAAATAAMLKAKKEQDMKNTPRGGNGSNDTGDVHDYHKLFEEAKESGDMIRAAYYLRMEQESEKQE